MKYLWTVFCLDGRKFRGVEGETSDEVIAKLGLTREDCRKWYPRIERESVKRILTEPEKLAQAERFKLLKERGKHGTD